MARSARDGWQTRPMRRYVGDPQARERRNRRVAIIVSIALLATFVIPAFGFLVL